MEMKGTKRSLTAKDGPKKKAAPDAKQSSLRGFFYAGQGSIKGFKNKGRVTRMTSGVEQHHVGANG